MNKEELLGRKNELLDEIEEIDYKLYLLNNLEKPYVVELSSYSGGSKAQFKTEEKARKKLAEYKGKKYFRNGLTYGVYMYKWNEDGTKTLLEEIPMGRKDFKANI